MSDKQELPTPRSFSLTFAAVFLIIGGWPWALYGHAPRYWALLIAVFFAAAAFLAPRLLGPLNWLWYRFGLLLHSVVNPLVMALIYYVGVVPIGLVLRVAGKDLLRLKREPRAASYWIVREPPGPEPGSMSKQF